VTPLSFIPISARNGDNLASKSETMPWYTGSNTLEHIDSFIKQKDDCLKPFRMPVQDVYKFTESGDDRRIIAGTVEAGEITIGDNVTFVPSGKNSVITSIEGFNSDPKQKIGKGYATGFTIKDELYLPRGEVMCKTAEKPPLTGTSFKANIFWMSRAPMIQDKKYKIKIGSARVNVRLVEVLSSIDATELTNSRGKQQIDRHDVAECIFETTRPIAFDTIDDIQSMGRFVVVDNCDISGGGIITALINDKESILNKQINNREISWDTGIVTATDRQRLFGHKSNFILITGGDKSIPIAKGLEKRLIQSNKAAYYLGPASLSKGLDADVFDGQEQQEEQIRRLGELARILTDAGILFITALSDADTYDLDLLERLTTPNEFLHVFLSEHSENRQQNIITLNNKFTQNELIEQIIKKLSQQEILMDYMI
jgi:bifunctional enzyme CysN/CysC